ncbi:tRNA epoxyqueuosine(34) reductase QueG [Alkaliphilus peptidifermentans]|uniref:Epoxyqueuosine reductase n=1 Tax=Alkaliphilus peptidifermentans DSM 18978 TaxID=1120976 RepID=A0A1G5K2P8_9FIRM|nr:tRNA epoxyqueuosine(34) reductase QueG [Alkaliphilus peptidifermentans]SCY94952.1 epoxyqueuosine reductase [Alkaliphilus peptidifermentans DSM 18978]
MNLKQDIITFSKTIGVDLIGFTSAEPFEEIRATLEDRKKRNLLSGFEEQDLEKRIDPRRTMANAKSIIVIGQSYYYNSQYEETKYYGDLARTAWGRDYHLVLAGKLDEISNFINSRVRDFQYKGYVDTGPLVDRHLAYRAGLGWYGHNATLINDVYGSWFFIGYLITNIELESDKPLDTKCAGCNICIEQCPGGAIEEPYIINAKKCLSNILQQKSDIPIEKRKILGRRLYGCDICQTVCPHNKNAKEMTGEDFIPSILPNKIDLIKLLNISNKEYKELFETNASGWRGKRVLQRNAIIALVNYGDRNIVPHLIKLLKDNRPEIRRYALWGIIHLDRSIGIELAKDLYTIETDENNKKTIEDYFLL